MSDDEDEKMCPLCVEEMDLSDKNFLPCPCGYRVCMWCWHHIRENLNGLCPACRTPYNADPHAFSAVDRNEIVRKNKERKQKEKAEKKTDISGKVTSQLSAGNMASALSSSSGAAAAGSGGGNNSGSSSKLVINSIADRRHLHNYRVIQRNLVYVIGVPASAANDETLRKPEYFGQYGKISKMVIHRNAQQPNGSVSAYVTFVHKDDAKAAIQALDGFWFDSHLLRASFGTTKYCNNFIRGVPCSNPECVYLHDLGDDDDRFTKEEIQAGHSKLVPAPGTNQTIVTGQGGPSGTGKRPTSEPIFPAPVFIQDMPSTASSTTAPVALLSQRASASTPTNPSNTSSSNNNMNNNTNSSSSGSSSTNSAAAAAAGLSSNNNGIGIRTTSWPSIADKLKEDLAKQEREQQLLLNQQHQQLQQQQSQQNQLNLNSDIHFPVISESAATVAASSAGAINTTNGSFLATLRGSIDSSANSNTSNAISNNSTSNTNINNNNNSGKEATDNATNNSNSNNMPTTGAVLSTRNAKLAARKQQQQQMLLEKESKLQQQRETKEAQLNTSTTNNSNSNGKEKEKDSNNSTKTYQTNITNSSINSTSNSNSSITSTIENDSELKSEANNVDNIASVGSVSPLTVSSTAHAVRSVPVSQLPPSASVSTIPPNSSSSQQQQLSQQQGPQQQQASIPPLSQVQILLSTPLQSPTLSGPHKHGVFPLPLSSFNTPSGIWSYIIAASNAHSDLSVNPYGRIALPVFSELLDAVLPPVDGNCLLSHDQHALSMTIHTLNAWPRPESYYRHGCVFGMDGVLQTHTIVVQQQHQQYNNSNNKLNNSSTGIASNPNTSAANAGQPSSASNAPSATGASGGIAALQQMFPGVKMSFGPPGQPTK